MAQTQVSLEEIYKILIELRAKMQKFDKVDQYIEDLEFARRTEEAWQEIDAGNGITKSKEEFLKDFQSW